jgi:hypothetical protein
MVIKVVHKIFQTNLNKYKTFKFQRKIYHQHISPYWDCCHHNQPKKMKENDQLTFNIIQIINNKK